MLQYTLAANETERECFSGFEMSRTPSTLRMGLLLYAQGVTNRWQHRKGPSGMPPFAMMEILSASLATAHRWLHSLSPRAPGKAPGRHVGGCAGAQVQGGSLSRQAPCRGRCLVAPGSLSLTGPCRDAWRVAASSLRCLGWPSRQAPLAGALSP